MFRHCNLAELLHVIMSENRLLSSMQDLEAALPIIEKYKDQLVAIGEVMIQYL